MFIAIGSLIQIRFVENDEDNLFFFENNNNDMNYV